MLRGILFDLDDTLVDHQTAADRAVVEWAAEHGVAGPDVVARWALASDRHWVRYQRGELTFAQQQRDRLREFLSMDVDDEQAAALFTGYAARYHAALTAFDDALPALAQARRAGLIVGVLTNGEAEKQAGKLARFGLDREVDALIASSTLPAGKPDPRAFAQAVQRLGLTAGEALMVGDSLTNDVHGALAAGLDAVLLDRRDRHPIVAATRIRGLLELFDHVGSTSGSASAALTVAEEVDVGVGVDGVAVAVGQGPGGGAVVVGVHTDAG